LTGPVLDYCGRRVFRTLQNVQPSLVAASQLALGADLGESTVMALRTFDGIANFPTALPVQADTSNLVVEAVIGGVSVTLALPGIEGSTATPARIPGRKTPEILESRIDGRWGRRVSSDGLYYIGHAAISFQFEGDGDLIGSPEFRAFGEAFESWFEIVSDWATALSGMLVKEFDSRSPDTVISIEFEPGWTTGTGGHRIAYVFPGSGLSAGQVRTAFHRASGGDELPAEYKLLHASWGGLTS
jgi:hypothetical protein